MRVEVKTGIMQPQAKEPKGAAGHQKRQERHSRDSVSVSKMNQPHRYFDLGLLTPELQDNAFLLY